MPNEYDEDRAKTTHTPLFLTKVALKTTTARPT